MIHSYLTGLLFHPSTPDLVEASGGNDLLLPLIELPLGHPISTQHSSRFPSCGPRRATDGSEGGSRDVSGHRSRDQSRDPNSEKGVGGRRDTLTVGTSSETGHSPSSSRSSSPYADSINYPERSISVVSLRQDVEEATKCGDYSSIHDLYQQTFSSPIELVSLLKHFPQKQSARIDDPELKVELMNELHDHINDLVRLKLYHSLISSLTD